MSLNQLFYNLKPFIPRSWQIAIRSQVVLRRRAKYSHIWPIDPSAGKAPKGWTGWPHGKKFALILTHDVDTAIGQEKCLELAKIEQKMGLRSSFNFVPERYSVSPELRNDLTENGFEVAVHGLCHDGKLFSSRKIFSERAIRINHYLKEWKSVGFHSPSMHRNLDWIHDLIIEYDQSTFDTDPFEPPLGEKNNAHHEEHEETRRKEADKLQRQVPEAWYQKNGLINPSRSSCSSW